MKSFYANCSSVHRHRVSSLSCLFVDGVMQGAGLPMGRCRSLHASLSCTTQPRVVLEVREYLDVTPLQHGKADGYRLGRNLFVNVYFEKVQCVNYANVLFVKSSYDSSHAPTGQVVSRIGRRAHIRRIAAPLLNRQTRQTKDQASGQQPAGGCRRGPPRSPAGGHHAPCQTVGQPTSLPTHPFVCGALPLFLCVVPQGACRAKDKKVKAAPRTTSQHPGVSGRDLSAVSKSGAASDWLRRRDPVTHQSGPTMVIGEMLSALQVWAAAALKDWGWDCNCKKVDKRRPPAGKHLAG